MPYIFPDNPKQIEPLIFEAGEGLLGKSYDLAIQSAKLSASIHPISADAVGNLVSSMNCYYSNLIEGHNTKPVDIERAMLGDYSSAPEKRILQLEARAHIEVEKLYLAGIAPTDQADFFSTDFICAIHKAFYSRLPDDLHWAISADKSKKERVEPGDRKSVV